MSLDTKTFRKAASILLTTALLTVVSGLVPVQAATTQPITVLLDGKPMTFDQPPVMSADGRVMVPFRAIFEALGATVQWNQNQQLVTATLGQNMINELKLEIDT